jgi:hypothetical protein
MIREIIWKKSVEAWCALRDRCTADESTDFVGVVYSDFRWVAWLRDRWAHKPTAKTERSGVASSLEEAMRAVEAFVEDVEEEQKDAK